MTSIYINGDRKARIRVIAKRKKCNSIERSGDRERTYLLG
jgi:hypothetical protein